MGDWFITPEEYEMAERNGISRKDVNNRVHYHCWSIKRACTEPIKKRKYTFKNITDDMRKKLEENSIPFHIFTQRMRLGWDLERALNTPVYSKEQCGIIANNARRRITEEQYKRAEINGVSRATFKARILTYHWDIETAINTPVLNLKETSKRSHWRKRLCFGKEIYKHDSA